MNHVIKQLLKIRDNPLIYLGKPSLERLKAFMDGYSLRDDEIRNEQERPSYDDLLSYVFEFYCVDANSTSQNWVELIKNHSNSQKDELINFFVVLDAFILANKLEQ